MEKRPSYRGIRRSEGYGIVLVASVLFNTFDLAKTPS